VPAWAFSLSNHFDITLEALKASALSEKPPMRPNNWEFTESARKSIARANQGVDVLTLGGISHDSSKEHFDNGLLHDGAAHVNRLRQSVIWTLQEAERFTSGSLLDGTAFTLHISIAQEKFGAALHTVQDFYAHSNWIELDRTYPADMIWWDGRPKAPFLANVESQCTCGRDVVGDQNQLVTGIFTFPLSGMYDAAVGNRCVHGPILIDSRGPIDGPSGVCDVVEGLLIDHHPGISKDKREGTPQQQEHFERAKKQAVLASAAFAQSVLYELEQRKLYVALCAFLGHGNSRTCLNQVTHEREATFEFSSFGIGAYKTDEVFAFDIPKFDPRLGNLRAMTSTWTITVEGTAMCPADPGAIISGANLCVGIRRVADLSITSPEQGVGALYCKTRDDLRSSVCGFGGLLPDNFGFSYHIWSNGSKDIDLEFEDEYRNLYPPVSFIASDGSDLFHVDGTFVSRMLLFLGVDKGPGNEPGVYTDSGAFLSFNGTLRVRLNIGYEYVPDPAAIRANTAFSKGAPE